MYVPLEFWQKIMAIDPYYEPTIVVHDADSILEIKGALEYLQVSAITLVSLLCFFTSIRIGWIV